MRSRTIIILLLFPLLFLWAIGRTLMSTGEGNRPQKRKAEASLELTTYVLEEEPETIANA